jgi:hypothetical protein
MVVKPMDDVIPICDNDDNEEIIHVSSPEKWSDS